LKIPFTSKRKRASIVVYQPEADHYRQVRVYTKGGPDFLMPDVSYMLDNNCIAQPINSTCDMPEELDFVDVEDDNGDYNTLVSKTVKVFAAQAFRTILVCYRDMSIDEFNTLKA
jgi:magnesium-transporting ATPase (P-type)